MKAEPFGILGCLDLLESDDEAGDLRCQRIEVRCGLLPVRTVVEVLQDNVHSDNLCDQACSSRCARCGRRP